MRTLLLTLIIALLLAMPVAAKESKGCQTINALLKTHTLVFLPFSDDPDTYGWPDLGDDYFDKRIAKCYNAIGSGWREVQVSTKADRMILFIFGSAAVSTDANGDHYGLHDVALYELTARK